MYIKIDDLNVHYKVEGEGDHVLLLHGWGANLETFNHVRKNLSSKYKVFSLDFPGFGKSEEPKDAWGMKEYCDFTEKFIKTMGIKNPILFGHSFGGRVSIILSSKNNYKKLVLIDSAGIKPRRSAKYYFKVYTYKTIKNVAKIPPFNFIMKDFMELYKSKAGSSDYNNASPIMKKVLVKVVNEDLTHYLDSITAETLLVWGDLDTATPLSDAKIMESKVKNSGLVVLKGAGHFSYLEQPHEFNSVINSFLSEGDKRCQ